MLKSFAAALLITASLAAHAQAPAPPATSTSDKSLASLDRIFQDFMREHHVPGLVYGVVADGKLVRVRGFGVRDLANDAPVTADTVFRIASMSKQFAALATLRLRDAGKLQLDTNAADYIPELAQQRLPTTDSPPIRLRDLLSHAGGFVTDDPWGDRQLDITPDDFSRMVAAGVPLSRAPGTGYEYSNYGYALVGRAISNRAQQNYADYIQASFFAPLGMTSTVYDVTRIAHGRLARGYRWEREVWRDEPALGPGEFGAMGGVATNANDYAKYVAWLLAAWPPRDGAEDGILKRASVREIARPQNATITLPSSERDGCPRATAYGLGIHSAHDCVLGFHLGHSGGLPGYGSNVLFLPDRGVAVFAFANRTYAPASTAVRAAANQLVRSETFPARQLALSPGLRELLDVALRIYETADVLVEPDALAMNFLQDHGAALRNQEIGTLRRKTGACRAKPPYTSNSAMGGTFELECERGKIKVTLQLAPTARSTLQKLEYVPAL